MRRRSVQRRSVQRRSVQRRVWPDAEVVFTNYGARTAPVPLASWKALTKETLTRRAGLADWFRSFDLAIDTRSGDHAALLPDLPQPDAVFIGGGADAALIAAVLPRLAAGGRLVVNAVTLETEALLTAVYARHGGNLLRIELAEAAPLGSLTGWVPARPVVQWSVTR